MSIYHSSFVWSYNNENFTCTCTCTYKVITLYWHVSLYNSIIIVTCTCVHIYKLTCQYLQYYFITETFSIIILVSSLSIL